MVGCRARQRRIHNAPDSCTQRGQPDRKQPDIDVIEEFVDGHRIESGVRTTVVPIWPVEAVGHSKLVDAATYL